MRQVEIFKTDVKFKKEAQFLLSKLRSQLPEIKANFDLDDCENILRVEGQQINLKKIEQLVNTEGYIIEIIN